MAGHATRNPRHTPPACEIPHSPRTPHLDSPWARLAIHARGTTLWYSAAAMPRLPTPTGAHELHVVYESHKRSCKRLLLAGGEGVQRPRPSRPRSARSPRDAVSGWAPRIIRAVTLTPPPTCVHCPFAPRRSRRVARCRPAQKRGGGRGAASQPRSSQPRPPRLDPALRRRPYCSAALAPTDWGAAAGPSGHAHMPSAREPGDERAPSRRPPTAAPATCMCWCA